MLKPVSTYRRSVSAVAIALALALFAYTLAIHSGHIGLQPGAQLSSSEVVYTGSKDSFPRQIIDPLGRSMTLEKPPSAILSATLVADDMLSRLVDLSRIRSVTYLVDDSGISNAYGQYPESIQRNYGAVEEIIAAEPDLLIFAPYSDASHVEMLLNIGIPVLRFSDFDSHQDIRNNLLTLAAALGVEAEAKAWIAEMDARIATVQETVKGQNRPRVLYYSLSGYSFGPGSLMDETIQYAGGRNVIAELGLQGYTRISAETVIALQPDVILLSGWNMGDGTSAKDILMADDTWKDVPAVADQRVYSLRGAWLTSSTPYRVKGIEEVARLLHPGAFALVKAEDKTS